MSGVEEGTPGGQGTPWCISGAGLASGFVTLSLDVDGGKLCLPTVVREKDARLHVPGNAGSSENSTPKLCLHAKQGHQNLEFSSPDV